MRARAAAVAGGPAVLAALVAWNVGNYVFFLAAGRFLGPADFGLAAALLAVTVIVSVPGNALQYGVAHSVAAPAEPADGVPSAVYRRAWRRSLWSPPRSPPSSRWRSCVAGALDADVPVGPMLLTLLVVLPMAPLFLSLGQLQGERRYGAYATAFALWGVPRPAVPDPAGARRPGGLRGDRRDRARPRAPRPRVAAVMTAAPRWPARWRRAGADWAAFTRSLPPVVVGLSAVACLTNLDVVAAKLSLSADDAGYFGAEAVLGKAVIIVPQALAIVLLPRVAARRVEGGDTGRQLALAVAHHARRGRGGGPAVPAARRPHHPDRLRRRLPAGRGPPRPARGGLDPARPGDRPRHPPRGAQRPPLRLGGRRGRRPPGRPCSCSSATAPARSSGSTSIAGVAVLVVHEVIHGRDRDGIVRGLVAAGAARAASRRPLAWRPCR